MILPDNACSQVTNRQRMRPIIVKTANVALKSVSVCPLVVNFQMTKTALR